MRISKGPTLLVWSYEGGGFGTKSKDLSNDPIFNHFDPIPSKRSTAKTGTDNIGPFDMRVRVTNIFLTFILFQHFPVFENFCKVSLKLHPRPFKNFFSYFPTYLKFSKCFQTRFSSSLKIFCKIHSLHKFPNIL